MIYCHKVYIEIGANESSSDSKPQNKLSVRISYSEVTSCFQALRIMSEYVQVHHRDDECC